MRPEEARYHDVASERAESSLSHCMRSHSLSFPQQNDAQKSYLTQSHSSSPGILPTSNRPVHIHVNLFHVVRPPREPRFDPHAHHVPNLQLPHELARARLAAPSLRADLVRARRVRVDVVLRTPRDGVRLELVIGDLVALDREGVIVQQLMVQRRLAIGGLGNGVDGP